MVPNNHILVIADDFSGAAEIAGIGHRYGLPTRLVAPPWNGWSRLPHSGLTVIDTATRSLHERLASFELYSLLEAVNASDYGLIYKKIDSVLRGAVFAELATVQKCLRKPSCALLPQNPSRRRTIVDGIYHIDGVPLHETEFARDPEHPATTSVARVRAGIPDDRKDITIVDADSTQAVAAAARQLSPDTLPVGGADFFEAILATRGFASVTPRAVSSLPAGRLFVCGTASAQRDVLWSKASAAGAVCVPISLNAENLTAIDDAAAAIALGEPAMIYINHGGTRTFLTARACEQALAQACKAMVARGGVRTLFAEGGSTAAAVCGRLGWKRFAVEQELAHGVVALKETEAADRPVFIVKPGSYAWPDEIWS